MSVILCIETSEKKCSAAIFENNLLLAANEAGNLSHSEKLAGMVDELLQRIHKSPRELSAISISSGPGSYTGLRVGSAFTKGMCYALNIPLITIPTLKLIAYQALMKSNERYDFIATAMDARRDEVYFSYFNTQLNQEIEPVNLILEEDSLGKFFSSQSKILVAGSGAQKLIDITKQSNLIIEESVEQEAKFMGEHSLKKLQAGEIENIAYFEPFYLKNFQIGKTKKLF